MVKVFLGENCLQTTWDFKETEIAFLSAKLFIASYPALNSASGMRSLGEGCRLSREHSQEQTAKSSFSSQQRDAMGDRNLLNPEIGGRQMSGTCFLRRWDLPWVGAKGFWHTVCRVSHIPEQHSWLSLPFAETRYPVELVQCCHFSRSSKTLDPRSLLYFELRRNGDLALKVVGFSCTIQLSSCESMRGGQRRVIHSCCPSRWFLAAQ